MAKALWPEVEFYRQQREIIYSVRDNDETIVPAGHMLGKDFVTAFIVLWFFLTRSPCRVITTSVDFTQLQSVLWGEIRRFIRTSSIPLERKNGGVLLVNHLYIRKYMGDELEDLSYVIGRVAAKGEGMSGHHIANCGDGVPRTLFVADEASGVDDESYLKADAWAHRKLIIGNPYPCTNFFYKGVKEGDLRAQSNNHYYRKIIRIKGADSPNVRWGHVQKAVKEAPDNRILVPGLLSYEEYCKRRTTWDPIRQKIGIDAEFYEGSEVWLYPSQWLDLASRMADGLRGTNRIATSMGIDSAEGRDSSCWCVVDAQGIIHQVTQKTSDTSKISDLTLGLMSQYRIPATSVFFDRGGGGKQHADYLRRKGYMVKTVGFGEPIFISGNTKMRRDVNRDSRYAYKNRRAEMYGMLRDLLDPQYNSGSFAIPSYTVEGQEVRRQLSMMPLLFDEEGKLYLPPKDRRNQKSGIVCLRDILGRSPDEADSLVLAVYGMNVSSHKTKVGAL